MAQRIFTQKKLEKAEERTRKESSNQKKGENLRQLQKFFQTIERPPTNSHVLVSAFVIAVLAGLVAGMIGQILIFSGAVQKIDILKDLSLENILRGGQVTVQEVKNVTLIEDDQVVKIINELSPSLVGVFDRKAAAAGDYLTASQQQASGVIISSDGWLMTSLEADIAPQDLIILTREGKEYPVAKLVRDPLSQTVFLKIAAEDLAAVKLGEIDFSSIIGEKMIVLSYQPPLSSNQVVRISAYSSLTALGLASGENSESFSRYLVLPLKEGSLPNGAPVVNFNGEVVGLLQLSNNKKEVFSLALPVNNLVTVMSEALRNGQLSRSFLGVSYLDLTQTAVVNSNSLTPVGALLVNQQDRVAVLPNSPAQQAGLRAGDIIIAVEEENLSSWQGLTELIQQYKPSQTVNLTVLRGADQEVKVAVTLAEFKK